MDLDFEKQRLDNGYVCGKGMTDLERYQERR